MHDPSAQRIFVHLAPYYREGEVWTLGGGPFGRTGRLEFDTRIREGSSRIFVYLKPGLSAQRASVGVMALGALGGGCRERQDDEHHERAREHQQRLSTHA